MAKTKPSPPAATLPSASAVDVQALAERFCLRFKGLARGHGFSRLVGVAESGQKQATDTGWAHEPVTVDHWAQHLLGIYGIGQTPIRDDGTCVFGAIDIDVYDLDHVFVATQVDLLRLPLTVVRSKSGGAHLYLFLSEPAPADLVKGKLMEWAVALGHARVEVYPKQTRLAGAADNGNWLNMPYFGALTPDGAVRVAVLQSGDRVPDPLAFLDHADRVAVSVAQLKGIEPPIDAKHRDLLLDAPPCLQSLAVKQFPKGSRNNALFDIGVYLKKRFPDDWEARVDKYNQTYMDPPLGSKEVQATTKSLQKKQGYFFRCNDDPIVSACNKTICYTRKYGIGQGADDPGVVFGPLVKIKTEPPIWLWDVNGKRIQLSTAELMSQTRFSLRAVEELGIWPTQVKGPRWSEIIREKLQSMDVIEAPPEVTLPGRVRSYLYQFLTHRRLLREFTEQAARGVPVLAEGRVWFHMPTFVQWLQREMRFTIEPSELYAVLRDQRLEDSQKRCGSKNIKLWSLPAFDDLLAAAEEKTNGQSPEEI